MKKSKTSKINKCRSCFSEEIETVIDLGMQPWGNDFRSKDSKEIIPTYPLAIDFCHRCAILNLNYTVPKEIMFFDHTYVTGITQTLRRHFSESAIDAIQILTDGNELKNKAKVLDIGSNDGTLLREYQKLDCEVLGVESAKNIAAIAQKNGIPTTVAFFNEKLAESIDAKFDLINASGVFFHLEELHSVIKGIKKLLSKKGVFVVQFIYLRDIIESGAFDQIYHEHLVYYLFTTLSRLLEPYGLEIFDAKRSKIHGGSGIAYITHKGVRKISTQIISFYAEEHADGFLTIEKYQVFMTDIERSKREILEYIESQISKGKVIYGMGAPVKGNTLLNYLGITSREIKCLLEINPLRKNKVAPGSRLPIILEDQMECQPDIFFCLAWNFKEEILKRHANLLDSGIEFYFPVINRKIDVTRSYEISNDGTMINNDKILITGGSGLVGSALTKVLSRQGFNNIFSISSKDCNLINKNEVEELFKKVKPDYVFHIAANTLGLGGNSKYQSDVLYTNVMINTNVLECSREIGVKKIAAMGSGCVYPDLGDIELHEGQIWKGPPHYSQAGYAHSKRLMLAQLDSIKDQYGIDYVFAISGNIYGPNDLFNVDYGNVTPSLILKFILAERNITPVNIWGSGAAIRDFSYSEDIAMCLYTIMNNISGPVNIGSGHRHTIKDIVEVLSDIHENKIEVNFDLTKPDGQMMRYYNLDKLASTNFTPKFDLKSGVYKTHKWLLNNFNKARF